MKSKLTITLAQINPTVGDIKGNTDKALRAYRHACAQKSNLLVLSELFISGYPPEDLILNQAFQKSVQRAATQLAHATKNSATALLVGAPWAHHGVVYNAALLCAGGKIQEKTYKVHLPNYGVFDEMRLFTPGPAPKPFTVHGVLLAPLICEDMWHGPLARSLADKGAEIFVALNGSPFDTKKHKTRLMHARRLVKETKRPLVYVNQVGGQDELVFDGASFVMNATGKVAVQMPAWQEAICTSHWRASILPPANSRAKNTPVPGFACAQKSSAVIQEGAHAMYQATVMGLGDYLRKNNFQGLVLGLSGGIDSALCAAIAVDACGKSNVHAVMMPTQYTSAESLRDAATCAKLLKIKLTTLDLQSSLQELHKLLRPVFAARALDVTEENMQARLRGLLLMALANKYNVMLLTTGNKSEMSVGYATLYGDMNGGFNPIKDLYKTDVVALAKWRNRHKPKNVYGPKGRVIPQNIILKPPTAELRANQKDTDNLPPYDVLDDILRALIDKETPLKDIVAKGHDKKTVRRVASLVAGAEHKRRQAPPGVKIGAKNFGRDRRYPIVNHFRDTP